jgi:hypothetical protein
MFICHLLLSRNINLNVSQCLKNTISELWCHTVWQKFTNFSSLLPDHMASHLSILQSLVWEPQTSHMQIFLSNWWLELHKFFTFWLFGMEWPHYDIGSLQWGCSCHSGNDNILILHWYYFIHSMPHKLTYGLFQRQVLFLYLPPLLNSRNYIKCFVT